MQVQKHSWVVAKTGLLIRDAEVSRRNPKMMTGITEHGTRIHFPESFLHHNATATELERIEAKAAITNAKRTKHALTRMKQMGFHVIHS